MMLKVSKLTCGYNADPVLRDVSFELQQAEFLGIIGPNGSGKTTLLRALTGMLKPASGIVLLQGQDIGQIGLKELARKVAVVSQSLPQGSLSVEEFVLLGRIPHLTRLQFLESSKDMEIATKSMSLTGTLGLKEHLIDQISGGEKQLVHIARALAQEPRLLLLDEPTAHLDIAHQVRILDLIRRLNREFGLTVVMVLHDLNLASLYCDRLLLLCQGRIYRHGSPDEVLTYQAIEEVYQTVVLVKENPLSHRPYIFLVSEEERLKRASR